MPELPEVEVVRRRLAPSFTGKRIEKVWVAPPSYFFLTPPAALRRQLLGRSTVRLERIGKYILAELDDDSRLLCHLGMTGQITTHNLHPDQHTHLILSLEGGGTINFRDVRKFGKVEFIPRGETSPRLAKLGPDALAIELDVFVKRIRARSLAIKTALLNQAVVCGIGNIYADEALFAAGVLPTRPARSVSPQRLRTLHAQLRQILMSSIEGGGSSISDYRKPDGTMGDFQHRHLVYGKRGQPCPQCGRALRHVVLGGRSTHYCASCQR